MKILINELDENPNTFIISTEEPGFTDFSFTYQRDGSIYVIETECYYYDLEQLTKWYELYCKTEGLRNENN